MTVMRQGDAFHDFELPDHRERSRRLSGYTRPGPLDEKLSFDDGYPLILVFARSFLCPRDQGRMRGLVRFRSELAVDYCGLVSVSAARPMLAAPLALRGGVRGPRYNPPEGEERRKVPWRRSSSSTTSRTSLR